MAPTLHIININKEDNLFILIIRYYLNLYISIEILLKPIPLSYQFNYIYRGSDRRSLCFINDRFERSCNQGKT